MGRKDAIDSGRCVALSIRYQVRVVLERSEGESFASTDVMKKHLIDFP